MPPAPAPWRSHRGDRGLPHLRMAAHAEIVVRTPDRHFALHLRRRQAARARSGNARRRVRGRRRPGSVFRPSAVGSRREMRSAILIGCGHRILHPSSFYPVRRERRSRRTRPAAARDRTAPSRNHQRLVQPAAARTAPSARGPHSARNRPNPPLCARAPERCRLRRSFRRRSAREARSTLLRVADRRRVGAPQVGSSRLAGFACAAHDALGPDERRRARARSAQPLRAHSRRVAAERAPEGVGVDRRDEEPMLHDRERHQTPQAWCRRRLRTASRPAGGALEQERRHDRRDRHRNGKDRFIGRRFMKLVR